MFYYFNRRLPLTNGLLTVPDSETPEGGTEKINLKICMKCLGTQNFMG